MSNKVHKGQIQTVEGSAVGEFYTVPKFAYNATLQVEYIGEAKAGIPDSVNSHFIQKFVYDATLNLRRIMIASNKATAGCTEVSVEPIKGKRVKLIAHNGDFKEVEYPKKGGGAPKKDSERTLITLKTGSQEISGTVVEVFNDNPQEVVIELTNDNVAVLESNVTILETDLLLVFRDEYKDRTKRRWTHRERYLYDTEENS